MSINSSVLALKQCFENFAAKAGVKVELDEIIVRQFIDEITRTIKEEIAQEIRQGR